MKAFRKPLTKEEEALILTKVRSGDSAARSTLVEANMRLVAHISKKYSAPTRNSEDLISMGTIGLIKACNSFDYEKSNRFATYAARCIENEILMMLRREKKCSREISIYEPIGTDKEGNEINLMDVIMCNHVSTIEQMIEDFQLQNLESCIEDSLSPKEKQIIHMRYGIPDKEPMTQKQVAEIMGISRSYISRIEKRALKKLARALDNATS